MPATPSTADIEKALFKLLTDEFENVTIVTVKVLNRIDRDDDIKLDIQVVFEGKPQDLDARKVAGAVRHVRPELAKLGETAFPIFSFITKGDAGGFVPA